MKKLEFTTFLLIILLLPACSVGVQPKPANTLPKTEPEKKSRTILTMGVDIKTAELKGYGSMSKYALEEYNNLIVKDNKPLIPYTLLLKVFYYDEGYFSKHDGIARKLTSKFGNNILDCDFKKKIYTFNGNTISTDYILTIGDRNEDTYIVDGDIYVTLPFLQDIMNLKTEWDSESKTLIITN